MNISFYFATSLKDFSKKLPLSYPDNNEKMLNFVEMREMKHSKLRYSLSLESPYTSTKLMKHQKLFREVFIETTLQLDGYGSGKEFNFVLVNAIYLIKLGTVSGWQKKSIIGHFRCAKEHCVTVC